MWNLHLTTTGRVIPSDAEDMLEPCVSISALQRWRGLDDTPDCSSSSAAAVDYDDYNNIEGEGHGRIVVGLSRRSRVYLGERLLCDAASSYDLCPLMDSYPTLPPGPDVGYNRYLYQFWRLTPDAATIVALRGSKTRTTPSCSWVMGTSPDQPRENLRWSQFCRIRRRLYRRCPGVI